ncbi:MAG: GNAT family N-acetyltransferase [Gemmatimonadetes bacterium]|nr:GNAT family N-acetyltransferase [Gemmatimonadota bacterium]
MATEFDPRTTHPADLRPLLETDRQTLVAFLRREPEDNIYLLSRIAMDGVVNEEATAHGRFYGHFQDEELRGVIFFGHRKGVVLSGDGDRFFRACAELALGTESDWIILVGPRPAADEFLSHYRWRGRPMHLNRVQEFHVLRRENLPEITSALRPADLADLDDVVEMSEQMLLEDFQLPAGSLSRDGIRESMRHKILDQRTWLLEDDGEVVFKVDVSAQYAGGSQIEGVFTRPHRRGEGFARAGVAAVSRELLHASDFVSLHVDRNNTPARRAYGAAGFRPHSQFRLVLLKVTA